MKSSRRRSCLLLLLLGAALPAIAQPKGKAASTPAPAAVEQFGESVNVNVVNVDVYVTDKSGQRVNGLTKDDFEITEDGRAVTISNFYVVQGGKALVAGAEPPAAPGPPAKAAQARPAPLPEDQRLRLIVYI